MLSKHEGHYRDVYIRHNNDTRNPKYDRQIEQLGYVVDI